MKRATAMMLVVIVAIISSVTTFFVTTHVYNANLMVSEDSLPVSEFAWVEKKIEEYYLKDFDMKDVQYAGLKAMVDALDDPYSEYYTPEEFAVLNQEFMGEYFGLGMGISKDEKTGLTVVNYFLDGSPAEEAGVMVGDYIISVDGEDVTDKTLQEISMLCMGEEGTYLTLGVKRDEEVLEYEIIRRAITKNMVSYELLEDNIGYLKIVQFGGNCEDLFGEAMDFFVESGVHGVVVDLRNNPGGYMDTVVNVLDKLLPDGTLVYTEDKKGNKETWTSDEDCLDVYLAMIVNSNTASAAEIFAGAVQDYGYGEVIGTTTYGKGVVQMVPKTPTGGGLKITISEYFTPSGRSIDGNGIYPDYYIELQQEFYNNPGNYSFEEDAQVLKAIEVLKKASEGN